MSTKTKTVPDPFDTPAGEDEKYQSFVAMLSAFARASADLAALQQRLDDAQLESIQDVSADYARLQERLGTLQTHLEVVARAHPRWFGDARSLKTPFGVVKLTSATRLVPTNEELSIALIQEDESGDFAGAHVLRTRTELNLEALAAYDDATLRRLRIRRVTEDRFSIKPARVDLGKAVAAAGKEGAKQP